MIMKSTQSRKWDIHFATDVLEEKLPIDPLDILAVGGRGRSCKLNIPENLLTIPTKMVFFQDLTSAEFPTKGKGRGNRMIKDHGVNLNNINSPSESFQELSYRIGQRKLQDDSEWPSLSKPQELGSKKLNSNRSSSAHQIITTVEANSDIPIQPDEKNLKWDQLTHNGCGLLNEGQFSDCWEDIVIRKSGEREEINHTKELQKNSKFESLQCFNISNSNDDDKEQVSEKLLQNLDLKFDSKKEESESHVVGLKDNDQQLSYSEIAFLLQLEDKDCYVLIENIPINTNDDEFQEMIESFGSIDVFLIQSSKTEEIKTGLVKMENSSQCDWIISCFDGSFHDDSTERLVVRRVEDILEAAEENIHD